MRNVLIVIASLSVLGGLLVLAIVAFLMHSAKLPTETTSGPPYEPCNFEAPESARGAAQRRTGVGKACSRE